MLQLRTFEDTLTLICAVLVAAIAYKIVGQWFAKPLVASALIGVLFAIALAIVTSSMIVIQDSAVTYRSFFSRETFPLREVERVGVVPSAGLLPGKTIVFRMRPSSQVNGHLFRVGIVTMPNARGWADAVNTAIRREPSN